MANLEMLAAARWALITLVRLDEDGVRIDPALIEALEKAVEIERAELPF